MGRASQGAELADNDLAIKSAKARIGADGLPKVAEYRIKGIERLTLRVEPTGTATFWFRHSYKGKLMREKLGRRGSNPWRSIRAKALECNAIVAEGRNPFAVSQAVAGAVTIGQLWDEWVQRFGNVSSKDRKSARTIQYYEQALNQFVWPKFKRETPAHELTTEVLADWLNQLEFKKKLSGSRVHAIRTALGTMFRFAAKRNRGGLKNPLRELGFTHKSNPRDVEPSALQIGAVWNAIDDPSVPVGCRIPLKLLILTGQRNGMVAGARVDELSTLDAANPEWRVKGQRMKARKEQIIPLPPLAVQLFQEAVSNPKTDAELFKLQVTNLSRAWNTACNAAGLLGGRNGIEIHDMRRAITKWGERNAVPYDVRKRILAHSFGDVTTSVYGGAQLAEVVRDALTRWEAYVVECSAKAASGPAEVVPMKRVA